MTLTELEYVERHIKMLKSWIADDCRHLRLFHIEECVTLVFNDKDYLEKMVSDLQERKEELLAMGELAD